MDDDTRERFDRIDARFDRIDGRLDMLHADLTTGLTELRITLGTMNESLARMALSLLTPDVP